MKINFNQIKGFGDYITWFIKQYQALQQKTSVSYIYKIINQEKCKKTHQEMLHVQVTGKNVFLKMNAKEIAADDNLLKGFSPLDIRTITYLACKEHFESKPITVPKSAKRSLYSIVAMTFSRCQKKHMLMIGQENKAEVITASVQSISNNLEMIDGFSSRDAHKIGYAAAVESSELIRNIKNE